MIKVLVVLSATMMSGRLRCVYSVFSLLLGSAVVLSFCCVVRVLLVRRLSS